jgi:hypothetical protein
VRAKFLKGPDERLAFRAARRPEEIEGLFVEDKLPAGHSAALGKKPLIGGEDFLLGDLAPGIHALHGGADLLADIRVVETVEDFQILDERHPLGAIHGLQFRFDFSETHGAKVAVPARPAKRFLPGCSSLRFPAAMMMFASSIARTAGSISRARKRGDPEAAPFVNL